MKQRQVIYLLEQPLDERNFERFGIQTWADHGWRVEVWDLTPWAHPAVWDEFKRAGHALSSFPGYFPLRSWRELKARLASAGAIDYVIDLTGEDFSTLRAKWALTRAGATRVTCALGTIPVPAGGNRRSLWSRAREVLIKGPRGTAKFLSHAFFLKVVAPRMPLEPPVAVVGGDLSSDMGARPGRIIRAHNFDYDIFLRLNSPVDGVPGRYVVFIDQDYCFHPEFVFQRSRPVATPERYFPAICAALTAIGQTLSAEVRIAAHPRAAYTSRGKAFFANFTVEYGKTAELIRSCCAVVCHDSTAIQFAVLFGKPIIFVTTEELSRAYEGRSIAAVAAQFGKTPVNLDRTEPRIVDWSAELAVDAKRYSDYRERYIKAGGSPEKPLWEIVIEQLEREPATA